MLFRWRCQYYVSRLNVLLPLYTLCIKMYLFDWVKNHLGDETARHMIYLGKTKYGETYLFASFAAVD